eukprot:6519488-Pyramimonas_sp.AAC.1
MAVRTRTSIFLAKTSDFPSPMAVDEHTPLTMAAYGRAHTSDPTPSANPPPSSNLNGCRSAYP